MIRPVSTRGRALGLVETLGFVPAVEAADAAVKTAQVELIEFQTLGAGIVCVQMTGEVSAVQAAVEAGALAAGKLGTLRSSSVIARTGEGLDDILVQGSVNADIEPAAEIREDLEPQAAEPAHGIPAEAVLEKMKVAALRSLARNQKDLSIPRSKLKNTNKKALIQALLQIKK